MLSCLFSGVLLRVSVLRQKLEKLKLWERDGLGTSITEGLWELEQVFTKMVHKDCKC